MSIERIHKRISQRSQARRDQRGAALVESAIIILPLCIILFGIIEFGFVFKDSLTLSSASRAGARTASAATESDAMITAAWEATKKAGTAAKFQNGDTILIYKADENSGLPVGGAACSSQCAKSTYNNGAWSNPVGTWPASARTACLGGTIDSVGVQIKLKHQSITQFFPFINNMELTERTVMRLEPTTDSC